MKSNATSYEELSKIIVQGIKEEPLFSEDILIPKIKSIIKVFNLKLAHYDYTKIDKPNESARKQRHIEKLEIERAFYKNMVNNFIGDEKMRSVYDELDSILKERGYK